MIFVGQDDFVWEITNENFVGQIQRDYFEWVIMNGGLIAQCQWMNAPAGGRCLLH